MTWEDLYNEYRSRLLCRKVVCEMNKKQDKSRCAGEIDCFQRHSGFAMLMYLIRRADPEVWPDWF